MKYFIFLLLCLGVYNAIFAQQIDKLPIPEKKQYALTLQPTADFYLNSTNFRAQRGYTPIKARNTWSSQTVLNLRADFGRKNYAFNVSAGFGNFTNKFDINCDMRKLVEYPIVDSFQISTVDMPRRYLVLAAGCSKRWELSKKLSLEAYAGLEFRRFSENQNYSILHYFKYESLDTNFTVFYATHTIYNVKNAILLNLHAKLMYNFTPIHAVFFSFGLKHHTFLPKGPDGYLFSTKNDRREQMGRNTYDSFQRQLNFGLGYQMSF